MAQQLWEQGRQQAAIPRRPGLQLVYYIFELDDLAGAERFVVAAASGIREIWRYSRPVLMLNASHVHIKQWP